MNLVTLKHGPALQSIWARDSYAITAARTTFARAHGIAPSTSSGRGIEAHRSALAARPPSYVVEALTKLRGEP